ncbi:hypothetical protein KKA00_09425 [bacterium]|nr:hypothetical protein [bacterium]MBU1652429.1 hypothetical protein [bacterium]MBU1881304.1 hypothetical protein [bacterium]
MSTINQELLGKLQEEIGTGKTQVYWHIARKVEMTGLPRSQAAIALAMELGIKVSRYATEYDLEMIHKVEPGLGSVISSVLPDKEAFAKQVDDAQESNNGSLPFLDSKMIDKAHKNAEICAQLFLFENSIRLTVHAVMEKNYGLDWWYDKTPRDVMYETFDRRSGENGPKWRGQFGAEPIYYTDINDLNTIVQEHQEDFSKLLGKELHFNGWIDLVERIRIALTTANPITLKERNKFIEMVNEWGTIARQIYNNLEAQKSK